MRFSVVASTIALASLSPSYTVAFTSRSSNVNVHSSLSPTTTTTTATHLPLNIHGSRSVVFSAVQDDVSTTTQSSGSDAVELEGEYLAAFEEGEATLRAIIPEEKQPMFFGPLRHFVREYITASQTARSQGESDPLYDAKPSADRIVDGIKLAIRYGVPESPDFFQFGVTHKAYRGNPEEENGNEIDFYRFGCDFFGACMDMSKSKIMGIENIEQAKEQLAKGENVVFLANHQSEADPQVVSACLDYIGNEQMAADLTYVAGHKVTTDPLAIPFSMGRNLICIHSKKHINADPDSKPAKQRENLKAMGGMLELLKKGGCALWVAPSGGRDRRDTETGFVPCAPFDAKTIDMFRLMGNKSKKPTHYYSMAIASYDLCPPPDYLAAGVGEERNVRFVPVGLYVGKELKSEGGLESRREFRETAYEQCEEDYETVLKEIGMMEK